MKKFNDLDFKTDKMSYYINALEKKESNLFKKSINIEKTSARIMNTLASNLESLEKAVGDRK